MHAKQRAKKVVSDSPGLVNFAIGLAPPVSQEGEERKIDWINYLN